MMLLCLSIGGSGSKLGPTNSARGRRSFSAPLEELEHAPGKESLQAASDLPVRFAFGASALDVSSSLFVAGPTGEHRTMQRAVELTVTTSVEPVADGLARRCGHRCGTGKVGERRFAANTPRMGPRADHLGRVDRTNARLV